MHAKTFKPFDRVVPCGYELRNGDLFDAVIWMGMGRGNRDLTIPDTIPGFEIQTCRGRGWEVIARLNTETLEYTTEYRGNLLKVIRNFKRFFRRNRGYYSR